MSTVGVEPEHGRVAGGAGTRDSELDPVADRDVLGLAHPEHIASTNGYIEDDGPGLVGDPDRAVGGDLEGLVVAAVLLGRLRHQSHIGD